MIVEINEIITCCLGEYGYAKSSKREVYEYNYVRPRIASNWRLWMFAGVSLFVVTLWAASWHVLDWDHAVVALCGKVKCSHVAR